MLDHNDIYFYSTFKLKTLCKSMHFSIHCIVIEIKHYFIPFLIMNNNLILNNFFLLNKIFTSSFTNHKVAQNFVKSTESTIAVRFDKETTLKR